MYTTIHWTRHLSKPYSPYKCALNLSIPIPTINPLQHPVLPNLPTCQQITNLQLLFIMYVSNTVLSPSLASPLYHPF